VLNPSINRLDAPLHARSMTKKLTIKSKLAHEHIETRE
jgi:hypothetical protein